MASVRGTQDVIRPQRLPQRLYEAGRKGDVKEIQNLLQGFTKEEARGVLEHHSIITEPILNIAVRFKHERLVRMLVEYYGVNVDAMDASDTEESADETTPFMQSVLGGNISILRILCKKLRHVNRGFPLHRVCGGDTPNGTQVLKILIHSGADINVKNKKGLTPLMIASEKRATEMVKMLLQLGAVVNQCSPNGNTALHYAIKRTDEIMKESVWNRMQIVKVLVKYGAQMKPNNKGLNPLQLACIKGNADLVHFLAGSFSTSDKERADCLELLASSVYFNAIKRDRDFTIMGKINDVHTVSYDLLTKAMRLRTSHVPPLWKFSSQERSEGLLYRVETQTVEELNAIKSHGEGLIVELILVRQRILSESAYDEHLLPFITEYFLFLKNASRFRQAICLLTHRLRIQLRLPQRKFEHTIILLLGTVRRFRCIKGHEGRQIIEALMSFMEECYKCDISEKRFLLRWLYLTPLHLLYLSLLDTNKGVAGREEVRALTSRFLRATKDIKESVLSTYAHYDEAYLFGSCSSEPFRAVAGDNALHVACRHFPKKEHAYKSSVSMSDELAELLLILNECGEDVNERNSEGKTPLKVLLDKHAPAMTAAACIAVHRLLMVGADPDIKDKLEQTALHSVVVGYVSPHADITCDAELKRVLQMLLRGCADPNAMDKRGFTVLHLLIDRIDFDNIYHCELDHSIQSGGKVRQSFPEVLDLIQQYGGSADVCASDGRTVLDMCKGTALEEELQSNVAVSRQNWKRLSLLAARTIRLQRIPYRETTPIVLAQLIELNEKF